MMDDYPLTIAPLFAHGRQVNANSKVITFTGDGYVESTFAEVADRVAAGDLLCPIDTGRRDEFAPLMVSLSHMQDGLRRQAADDAADAGDAPVQQQQQRGGEQQVVADQAPGVRRRRR